MIIKQTGIFKRRVKKMHPSQKKILDEQIKKIIENPSIGTMKKGDLANIQVHKYKIKTQQYLLAYTYVADEIMLILIEHGTHENFYQSLKNH